MTQTRVIWACLVIGALLVLWPHGHGHAANPTASEVVAGPTTVPPAAVPETVRLRLDPTTTSPPVSRARDTTTVPAATTTTVDTDRQETTFPITASLPVETAGWSIDYVLAEQTLVLKVTLMPIVNRPDQAAARRSQLVSLKLEVQAWLASHGVRPGQYGMIWQPAEAGSL